MGKTLNWYLRRHPLLYKIRYRLVSKKVSLDKIENFCYNDLNLKTNIPPLFFEINHLIFNGVGKDLSDFEKAKTIAIWLKKNIKGGPGLGKSSTRALQKMINGEGGVCSDFSQIYSNFCVINDIKVKEWGMKSLSNESSVSGGHSFNEVYSKELQKWIMIDVAKSILFYDANKNNPLSTLEYIDFKKEEKEINIVSIYENDTFDNSNAKNIFLISKSLPFLITNYDNQTYDYFLDKLDFFPESIVHGILIFIGKSYTFEFPTKEN
ncbi:Transglutaminase-like superfamily protein [Flavobacterium fluvii]|uniref:Transglutaminase-like superfamily protein n=1 Tax=Flavobacterium fluvii TaxID=468056 RepID=A0A1M5L2C1_9FLAO|nr:transglutaminase domain-containing protein [Flavobacterium fluvii]SHG59188.1 Transglutaminase-like superfamily protein [Flavobacterium fluvii]